MNELQSQITLALIVPFLLQWLKGQKWFPLLSFYSGKVNAATAFAVASLGGLGIGFHFDYNTHQLIVSGLSFAGIWAAVQHIAFQFMSQHAVYRTVIAPPQPGAVQAQQRAAAPPPAPAAPTT